MPLELTDDGRIDYEQVDRDFDTLTPLELAKVRRQLIDDGDLDPEEGEYVPGETARSVTGNTIRELPLEVGELVTRRVSDVAGTIFSLTEQGLGLGNAITNQIGKAVDDTKAKFGFEPNKSGRRTFRILADSLEESEFFFKGLKDTILPPEEIQEVMAANLIPESFSDLDELAKSSEKFQTLFAQGVTTMAPMLVAGGFSKKMGTFAASYLLNAQANFQDLTQNTKLSEGEALSRAMLMAIPQAVLDKVIPDKVIKGGQFQNWVNIGWAAFTEGGTESMQEFISIMGRMDNPIDFKKAVDIVANEGGWVELRDAFIVGGAIGGTVGTISKNFNHDEIVGKTKEKIEKIKKEKKLQDDLGKVKPKKPDQTNPVSNPFPTEHSYKDAKDFSSDVEAERINLIKESAKNLTAELIVNAQTTPGAKPRDPKKPSIQGGADFNTNNFRTTDDVKIAMDVISDVVRKEGIIDPAVLKVQSNKSLIKDSIQEQEAILNEFEKDSGLATDRLRRAIRETKLSTDDLNRKVVTYRTIQNSTLRQLSELAEKIELHPHTDQDLVKWAALREFNLSFQPDLKSIGTNLGRALQSFNIVVNGDKHYDIRNLPEEGPDVLPVRDMLTDLLDLKNSREGIRKSVREFRKHQTNKNRALAIRKDKQAPPFGKALLEFWQAVVLGNPFMRSVEALGPMIAKVIDTFEDSITFARTSLRRDEFTPEIEAEIKARMGSDLMFVWDAAKSLKQGPKAYYGSFVKGLIIAKDTVKGEQLVGIEKLLKKIPSAVRSRIEIEQGARIPSISKENLQQSPRFNKAVSMVGRLGTVAIQAVRGKRASSYNVEDLLWWAVDQGGAAIRLPGFAFMQVFDPLFENMAFWRRANGKIHGKAWENVRLNQMSEDNVPKWIAKSTSLLKDFIAGKDLADQTPETREYIQKLFDESRGAAAEATFKERISGGKILNTIGDVDRSLKRMPVLKLLTFPFSTTLINLKRFATRRTPLLSRLSTTMEEDLAGMNGEMGIQRANSRRLMGYILGVFFFSMWWDDRLKGTFMRGERESKQKARILDNSINLPFSEEESFIQMTRADPIGQIGSLWADGLNLIALGVLGEAEAEEILSALTMATANHFFNKSYSQNVYDLFRAVFDDTGYYWEQYLTNQAVSFIPGQGLMKGIRENPFTGDETLRETRGLIDGIKRALPDIALEGLATLDRLRVRLFPGSDEFGFDIPRPELKDLTGEKVKRQPRADIFDLTADIFGLRRSKISQKPLNRELARVGLKRKQMKRSLTVEGVRLKLNNQQYSRLRDILHDVLQGDEQLLDVINSPEYRDERTSDKLRRKMIHFKMNELQTTARQMLFAEDESLQIEQEETRIEEINELLEPSGTPDTSNTGDLLR